MSAQSRPFPPLLVLAALLLPLFYFLDQNIHTQYVFDHVKLQEISQAAIAKHGNDTESLMRQVHQGLRAEYGDAIVADYSKEDWFWNNAGGAMVINIITPPLYPWYAPGTRVAHECRRARW